MGAGLPVPASQCAFFHQALGGGLAATIDLTALPGTNNGVVDGSGLKVNGVHFRAATALGADNGAAVTIVVGAANGYELSGPAFSITLAPGQEFAYMGNNATPDIAAADRTLDMTGANALDGVEVSLIMG